MYLANLPGKATKFHSFLVSLSLSLKLYILIFCIFSKKMKM